MPLPIVLLTDTTWLPRGFPQRILVVYNSSANILSERDRINNNVVEAAAYGALNFKPANTSTKGLDYILQSLLGYSATELRNGGVTNSSEPAKPGYICSETVVRLGICVFPTDQSNFYDTGGKIFKTSVNKLRQTGDEGATTPKLVIS